MFPAPWRDTCNSGARPRRRAQTNLIVPSLSLRRNCIRFFRAAIANSFGDQRARDAVPRKYYDLVDRTGLKHRKDKIAREFFAQIFDDAFLCAGLQRFRFQAFKFFFLTDFSAKGDDLGLIIFLKPAQDNGSVEAPRICEDNFHRGICILPVRHEPKAHATSIAERDFNVTRSLHHLAIGWNEP
jgi:hypothetical protein